MQLSKTALFASQKMGYTKEPEETYANLLDQLLLEMFLNKWRYTAFIFMQIKLQFGLGLCQAVIIAFFVFVLTSIHANSGSSIVLKGNVCC